MVVRECRNEFAGIEQRVVRTSYGCKEAVIENLSSNMMKKEEKETVELYYDFQKAYDNVNHAFLEELMDSMASHIASGAHHRDDGNVEDPAVLRGEERSWKSDRRMASSRVMRSLHCSLSSSSTRSSR